MTLDVSKWMTASIKLQQSISHNTTRFKVVRRAGLTDEIADKLTAKYGENFLNDADYIIFFKKIEFDFTTKDITKLYQILDRALGKGSNMLNKTDFEAFTDSKEGEGPFFQFVKITLKK